MPARDRGRRDGGAHREARQQPGDALLRAAAHRQRVGGWVTVDAAGSTTAPDFGNIFLLGALTIGGYLPGQFDIRNGGVVWVAGGVPDSIQTAHARTAGTVAADARIVISGTGASADQQSELLTIGDATLGLAAGSFTVVQIEGGGEFSVGESLSLAEAASSTANILLEGVATNGARSTLQVLLHPTTGRGLIIGRGGRSTLTVRDGAIIEARDIYIGQKAGSHGTLFVGGRAQGRVATVEVTSTSPSLIGSILVGGSRLASGDDSAPGELILNDGVIDTPFLVVAPAGSVRGQGTITVLHLMEFGGTIDPELDLEPPLIELDPDAEKQSPGRRLALDSEDVVIRSGSKGAKSAPGTLTIRGNVILQPTARVVLDVTGSGPTAADRIVVDGAVTLGGTLELNFSNGYAPRAGDTLDLLASTNATGAFSAVTTTGLAPGFQFTVAPTGAGSVRLAAVHDGVPTTTAAIRLSSIQRGAGGQFRIAWPADATGYRLEASLEVSGGWKDGESFWGFPMATEGAERVAYVPGGETARFFRLVKP